MVENGLSPVGNTKKQSLHKTMTNHLNFSNFGIIHSEQHHTNSDPKLLMNLVQSEPSDGFLNNTQLLNESMSSYESQTRMAKCLNSVIHGSKPTSKQRNSKQLLLS